MRPKKEELFGTDSEVKEQGGILKLLEAQWSMDEEERKTYTDKANELKAIHNK